LNYYALIIGGFIIVGLAITAFGWRGFQKGKANQQWPSITGQISSTTLTSAENDLLPDIRFSYTVDGKHYEGRVEFPPGTMPMPGFASAQLEKYPAGSPVTVHYNPQQPEQATLEPGRANDDWLILAMGIGFTAIGVLAMFFSG